MTYEFIPVSLIVIIVYLITHVLYKENVTTKAVHMKIWNIIILINCIILITLSFIFTVIIEYSISTPLASTVLFWHVEFGLALVPVSLIHIYFYRKSFRKITLRGV
jgi:membrane protein implicated in regulation of membrane protease activity